MAIKDLVVHIDNSQACEKRLHAAVLPGGGQLDQPGAATQLDGGSPRRGDGQPGLADPAGPHERHQRMVSDAIDDGLHVRIPPKQRADALKKHARPWRACREERPRRASRQETKF